MTTPFWELCDDRQGGLRIVARDGQVRGGSHRTMFRHKSGFLIKDIQMVEWDFKSE